jgi:hypothetical protein
MTHSVEDILGDVKLAVGRPTATAFVNPGAEDRFFILESLFAGAALFLVNRYFAGFFKPLEETGARHRQMAIRLLEELSKGTLSQKLENESRLAIEDGLEHASFIDTPERRSAGEMEVLQVLVEYGESEHGSAQKASKITYAIFRT